MFKLLKGRKGQGVLAQYSLTFFLVIAVITTMTLFVRRSIQGRLRDSRKYMITSVNDIFSDGAYNLVGVLMPEYEPYYLDRRVIREVLTLEKTSENPDLGGEGLWTKEYGSSVESEPGGPLDHRHATILDIRSYQLGPRFSFLGEPR